MSNVELVDSSEFHGSKDNEMKYYKFKASQLLQKTWFWKSIIYFLIWIIGAKVKWIALKYHLEGVYVITTGILLIVCNLGERNDGYSAYSVLGTFNMDNVDGMFGRERENRQDHYKRNEQIEEVNDINQDFDGLTADQMMAKISKLGNKLCFCNSGKKYKKCHYYIQQRNKYEEEEEAKKQKYN